MIVIIIVLEGAKTVPIAMGTATTKNKDLICKE